MQKLTREQVLNIIKLRKNGLNDTQIAAEYGVHQTTITYWVARLKKANYKLPEQKRGAKAIEL